MINSRAKGASAEREVSKLLYDHLGIKLQRNLEQSRNGGHDLIPEQGSLLEAYANAPTDKATITECYNVTSRLNGAMKYLVTQVY